MSKRVRERDRKKTLKPIFTLFEHVCAEKYDKMLQMCSEYFEFIYTILKLMLWWMRRCWSLACVFQLFFPFNAIVYRLLLLHKNTLHIVSFSFSQLSVSEVHTCSKQRLCSSKVGIGISKRKRTTTKTTRRDTFDQTYTLTIHMDGSAIVRCDNDGRFHWIEKEKKLHAVKWLKVVSHFVFHSHSLSPVHSDHTRSFPLSVLGIFHLNGNRKLM